MNGGKPAKESKGFPYSAHTKLVGICDRQVHGKELFMWTRTSISGGTVSSVINKW